MVLRALIADAPAMYALLERVTREWNASEIGAIDGDVIQEAEVLIAKHQK